MCTSLRNYEFDQMVYMYLLFMKRNLQNDIPMTLTDEKTGNPRKTGLKL